MRAIHLAAPAILLALALAGRASLPDAARAAEPALTSAAWLAAAWLAARSVDLLVARLGRADGAPAPRMLADLTRFLLFGLAVVGILSTLFGEPVTGFLATSSVLIAVLGFALRGIIADVFSGIALGVERAYRIGDWIEVPSGMTGRVVDINWRATQVLTNDGITVVVPNGMLAAGRVVNYSRPENSYRSALRITLDPGVPVARAKRVLLSAALLAPRVEREPSPDVVVEGVGERGISYVVRYWVPNFGLDIPCRDAVATAVAAELARAGLSAAAPRLRIERLRPESGTAGAGRALLAGVDLLSAFEPAELDEIASGMVSRLVPEGTDVVREGEPGSSLFVLGEGTMDVLRTTAAGEAVRIDRMRPGEVFGEMSLLTGEARSATIRAATEAVVHEIDRDHLEPLLRRRPELAERLASLMAERRGRNAAQAAARAAVPAGARAEPDILRRLLAFFGLAG